MTAPLQTAFVAATPEKIARITGRIAVNTSIALAAAGLTLGWLLERGEPWYRVWILVAAGCGLGAGDSQDGGATVTVTRDFGARELGTGSVDPIPGGETVMRMLQRMRPRRTPSRRRLVNTTRRG